MVINFMLRRFLIPFVHLSPSLFMRFSALFFSGRNATSKREPIPFIFG